MILGFEEYHVQAQRLACTLEWDFRCVDIHRFPDGESKIRLPTMLPPHVIFCRSLNDPNDKLIELLMAAKTAREFGARRLTLVAPYLCYMRQDAAFEPGEVISQKIIGTFLADLFDDVITVDPHLHRTHNLIDVVPINNAIPLSAASIMTEFLRSHVRDILMGPDAESEQWVGTIAKNSGLQYCIANKKRYGDREVKIVLPKMDYAGQSVVLIDDMVSSGGTMAMTAQQCLAQGAASVDILVTHPLFAEGAEKRLQQVGVRDFWSTDSISHPSNVIYLDTLLANAIRSLN